MEDLYVVTLNFDNGDYERRYTDEEHLDKAVEVATNERFLTKEVTSVSINKTYMCFDGYLTVGEFVQQINK